MSNDLCVQNRTDHGLPDWVDFSKIPDCPKFITTVVAPGPYNYWPWVIGGGIGVLVAICITIMVVSGIRAETKRVVNQKMLDKGMPDILARLENLETYTGKILT